jgi:RNA polymerase sigma-70 factor (ECF subfamily)
LDLIFGENNDKNTPEDSNLKPGENIEVEENKIALHAALKKLPEKQNVAVSLNSFEDLSYKEISEVMEISVTEVGVLINRGKKNLKKILIEYYKNN